MCSRFLCLIQLLVLFGLLIGPSSAFSAELSGIWSGNYSCSKQGRVATLTFINEETARFDFKPGKDAKPFPAGAYTMEIWRKGDELLLKGVEWIQKSSNTAMVSLRVTIDGNQLTGIVDHKNCGEIILEPFDATKTESARHTALPEAIVFPAHISGTYECKNQSKRGSYWKLTKTPTGDLDLSLTTRDTRFPERANQFEMRLNYSEGRYLGMESNGSWGVQLTYDLSQDLPTIEFLGRNGKTDTINCSIPEIQLAEAPKSYWDKFISKAGKEDIDIDTALLASYYYQTLPHESMLPALETEAYKSQRATLWRALPANYAASMPDKIRTLPVGTLDERKQARAVFQTMEYPGFQHKLNVSSLYYKHLLDNNKNPESLYFTETEVACERIRTVSNVQNSVAGLEIFVGLPASQWSDQTIESVINTAKGCAQSDTTLKKSSEKVIKTITNQIPNFRVAIERVNWVKESKKTFLEKPRTLATLLTTNNYQLSSQELRSNGISNEMYQREFLSGMKDASAEAMNSSKKELDALFMDDKFREMPVEQQLSLCTANLNNPSGQIPEWLFELYEICRTKSRAVLSEQIDQLREGVDEQLAGLESEGDIIEFVQSEPDNSLQRLAYSLEIGNEFNDYLLALDESKKLSIVDLENSVKEEFERNNQDSDAKIKTLCEDRSIFKFISNTCREVYPVITNRQKESQCALLVSSLDIPKNIINDILLYGNTLDTQEIQISNFSCELGLKGINVSISENGKVVGVEPKYGREIFSTELKLVNGNSESKYWEFNEISVNINDPRLTDLPDGLIVECLLECDF